MQDNRERECPRNVDQSRERRPEDELVLDSECLVWYCSHMQSLALEDVDNKNRVRMGQDSQWAIGRFPSWQKLAYSL